ncbi:MAG: sigma-54-dependent Fis family transcriptional regulator [Planctomycetes bacterium]|nr:sigma-54-dependent Fis family transcriptional regulator [Planctomycetota bacterium]
MASDSKIKPEPKAGEGLKLLIIDDEPNHAEAVAESLERVGYECVVATSGQAGARVMERDEPDVILTDLKMAGVDGLAILRKAKEELPDSEVVVITGHGDVQTAVEAMKAGAANFLQKPVNLAELREMVDRAAERCRLTRSNQELQKQLDEKFGFEGLVGNSPKMHEIIGKLKSIAPTAATVLIQGETGTGKELVAKAIHNNSPRKARNFVAMNCTALNENLLEDELFGHEAGAFTGADRLRKGRFEHANGGTLFLDEVGDMPLSLQAKLLRVLENQEVFRIGSNEAIKVNVRLLSATNRDLEAAVEKGSFRQDLYFRLKVVTVKLPPLRERREDITLLSARFIKEFNQRHGKKVTGVAEPLRKAMHGYDWPGNIRELRNLMESMIVQDQDGMLSLDDLQDGDTLKRLHLPDSVQAGPGNLVGRSLSEIERYYIEQTLTLLGGNREEAAKRLGIGERTLYRVIQDWKVQDRIREALGQAGGDLDKAAQIMSLKPQMLQRKMKKLGLVTD